MVVMVTIGLHLSLLSPPSRSASVSATACEFRGGDLAMDDAQASPVQTCTHDGVFECSKQAGIPLRS